MCVRACVYVCTERAGQLRVYLGLVGWAVQTRVSCIAAMCKHGLFKIIATLGCSTLALCMRVLCRQVLQ